MEGKDGEITDRLFNKKGALIEVHPGCVCIPQGYKHFGERILDLQIRPDDVFVVSFPRTGSTWTQELVWLLGHDLDYEGAKLPQQIRAPLLEISAVLSNDEDILGWVNQNGDLLDLMEQAPSPRYLKSHLMWHLLPRQIETVKPKIIYVARNPKDMCVSYYHYCCLVHRMNPDSFEEFCDLFLRGKTAMGNIWDHIFGFWNRRHEPNILFLKYEDMKKDFMAVIKEVARFLGKNPSEEEIIKLEEYLSFKNMQKNPAVNLKPLMDTLRGEDYMGHENRSNFIRKGVVGDWKNYMSLELVSRFDKWTAENINGTDFTFD
ncbi:hypothetical protein J437_LFUL010827 [Ladona fulva]|uniref:Sulfotransferase domain-containing protein n=1 Tax=Ladona fulva TaxID=123851 RepID=A0A8K0KAQ2_LADFU|nr:hypothetical protein J437_LFUL010827 [Ladona fulva]